MKLVVATRKSPLALVQAEAVAAHLREKLGAEPELRKIVTTGDRQAEWSLLEKGGKGLFTSELEEALRRGEADVAVHSTKDLPGEMADGLAVAGYLPRADVRDVLVLRKGVTSPRTLATSSSRRKLQVKRFFPQATFVEIRGNVDTRLRKIASDGVADGTILAAAGLARLGIHGWEGLVFQPLEFDRMVPAVGQGAIAIQCRQAEVGRLREAFDDTTARAVGIERAFQTRLGAGCQTAFGAHATAGGMLYLFHERTGWHSEKLASGDSRNPDACAARILNALGLIGEGPEFR